MSTIHAERRIRTLLAVIDPETYNLGDELVHSPAFRSDEWPRNAYALSRPDMEAVLAQLDQARSLRVDVSSLQSAIDPVKHAPEKVRAYLAANGWRETGGIRGFTEWGRDGETVTVLPDAASREYRKRMAIYVQAIATVHRTGELGVLAGIAEAGDE